MWPHIVRKNLGCCLASLSLLVPRVAQPTLSPQLVCETLGVAFRQVSDRPQTNRPSQINVEPLKILTHFQVPGLCAIKKQSPLGCPFWLSSSLLCQLLAYPGRRPGARRSHAIAAGARVLAFRSEASGAKGSEMKRDPLQLFEKPKGWA